MKKIWKKPELVIIARAEPGEIVLAACKSTHRRGEAYIAGNDGDNCTRKWFVRGCTDCSDVQAS